MPAQPNELGHALGGGQAVPSALKGRTTPALGIALEIVMQKDSSPVGAAQTAAGRSEAGGCHRILGSPLQGLGWVGDGNPRALP